MARCQGRSREDLCIHTKLEGALSRKTLQPVGLKLAKTRSQEGGAAQDRLDFTRILMKMVPGAIERWKQELACEALTENVRLASL